VTPAGQAVLISAAKHLSELASCLGEHLSEEEQSMAQSLCQRLGERLPMERLQGRHGMPCTGSRRRLNHEDANGL